MVRTPYQVVLRIFGIAEARWAEIDAEYATVDLIRFPLHRFLNCVFTWALNRVPPDKVEQFMFELEKPIPGRERVVSQDQIEEEGQLFMALMAQQSGS